MFATLFSVTLFFTFIISSVLADFDVKNPTLVQCQKSEITWEKEGSKGPYSVYLVDGNKPCDDPLADLGDSRDTKFSWTVDFPAGTEVMIYVESSDKEEGWSKKVTIGPSSDTSCLRSQFKTSATTASPSSSPVPIGAANAQDIPLIGGALSMRQHSVPALAFSAVILAVTAVVL